MPWRWIHWISAAFTLAPRVDRCTYLRTQEIHGLRSYVICRRFCRLRCRRCPSKEARILLTALPGSLWFVQEKEMKRTLVAVAVLLASFLSAATAQDKHPSKTQAGSAPIEAEVRK